MFECRWGVVCWGSAAEDLARGTVVAFIAVVRIMTRIIHPQFWTPSTKVSTILHTETVLTVENNELVLQTFSSMKSNDRSEYVEATQLAVRQTRTTRM